MGPPPPVPPAEPSNTFEIFWNIENRAPAAVLPTSSNVVLTTNVNNYFAGLEGAVNVVFPNIAEPWKFPVI